jgi:hypothetical protein
MGSRLEPADCSRVDLEQPCSFRCRFLAIADHVQDLCLLTI